MAGRRLQALNRKNDFIIRRNFIIISHPCTNHCYWLLQPPSPPLSWPAWNIFVTITILIVQASKEIFTNSLTYLLYIIHCFFLYFCIIHYFLVIYPARALRALGLLLADGTPTGGRGEDFLSRQPNFSTETAVTPERKVQKSFPRWEINRHVEG